MALKFCAVCDRSAVVSHLHQIRMAASETQTVGRAHEQACQGPEWPADGQASRLNSRAIEYLLARPLQAANKLSHHCTADGQRHDAYNNLNYVVLDKSELIVTPILLSLLNIRSFLSDLFFFFCGRIIKCVNFTSI